MFELDFSFIEKAEHVNSFNANLARLEPEKYGYDYTKNEALNTLRTHEGDHCNHITFSFDHARWVNKNHQ